MLYCSCSPNYVVIDPFKKTEKSSTTDKNEELDLEHQKLKISTIFKNLDYKEMENDLGYVIKYPVLFKYLTTEKTAWEFYWKNQFELAFQVLILVSKEKLEDKVDYKPTDSIKEKLSIVQKTYQEQGKIFWAKEELLKKISLKKINADRGISVKGRNRNEDYYNGFYITVLSKLNYEKSKKKKKTSKKKTKKKLKDITYYTIITYISIPYEEVDFYQKPSKNIKYLKKLTERIKLTGED